MKYLAYFQAYTNTYAELEGLKRKYEEALEVEDVVGVGDWYSSGLYAGRVVALSGGIEQTRFSNGRIRY